MNYRVKKAFAVAAICLAAAPAMATGLDSATRPSSWAQKITFPGLPNFYQVTTNLYRGAQPTAEGMTRLQALGVRYVISLRMLHSDWRDLHGTALKSLDLGMVPWHPNEHDVVKFLKAATDTNNLPMFVHCEHGADRTGLMCAIYRIVVCDWTKQEAIEEMENGGFNFSPHWRKLISFVEKADVASLKHRIGLADVKTVVTRGD